MLVETEVTHLLRVDFDSGEIGFRVERGRDFQSGVRRGFTDQTQDGGIVSERYSGPLLADLAEDAMFDGIPLGGSRGIMADGYAQAVAVGEFFLEGVFPLVAVGPIAPAAVGEDQEPGGAAITVAALATPPLTNAVDGKVGGIAGGADDDCGAVGLTIVNSVGNGDPFGQGRKIVVLHRDGLSAPGAARIFEGADQFTFLGVDADDGAWCRAKLRRCLRR